MAFAFDFIAPFVVNDVAYFICSVGLSVLVSSKRSKRTTMSLRLPSEREVPANFNSSTNSTSEKSFHTNVKAALDSCIFSPVVYFNHCFLTFLCFYGT